MPGLRRFSALCLLVSLGGCASEATNTAPVSSVASVTISPSENAILSVGAAATYQARARDLQDAEIAASFAWSSDNPAIASVTQGGVVTGVAAGTAHVAVSSGQKSATVTVTVTPVARVQLAISGTTLLATQSVRATAKAFDIADAEISSPQVAWTSSIPAVAEIDNTGNIVAHGGGTTLIKATIDGRSGTALLSVLDGAAFTPVGGNFSTPSGRLSISFPQGTFTTSTPVGIRLMNDPSINPKRLVGTQYDLLPADIILGHAATLTLQYDQPSGILGIKLARLRISRWNGSDWVEVPGSSVDTVTRFVTGPITAFGSFAVLEVRIPVATISISPPTVGVPMGSVRTLSAIPRDSSGAGFSPARLVNWSTGNSAVATISNTGVVTPVSVGTTTVTVISESAQATAPLTIAALPFDLVSLNSGLNGMCGLNPAGRLFCWGQCIPSGCAWTSATQQSEMTFSSVSRGAAHTCAVRSTAQLYCWGSNANGELGVPGVPSTGLGEAVPVSGITGTITAAGAGQSHSCALASGLAWCWGKNDEGQLGDGTFINRAAPVSLLGGMTFSTMGVGSAFACALRTTGGEVWCWGDANAGELGNNAGQDQNTPVRVVGGRSFTTLSVGGFHSCGLVTNGDAYCWGRGQEGQMGQGNLGDSFSPVKIPGGPYSTIVAGYKHTCALISNGTAYCWGAAAELGNPTNLLSPTAIPGSHHFSLLGTGMGTATCGRELATGIWCWGLSADGQTGNGSFGGNGAIPTGLLWPNGVP